MNESKGEEEEDSGWERKNEREREGDKRQDKFDSLYFVKNRKRGAINQTSQVSPISGTLLFSSASLFE